MSMSCDLSQCFKQMDSTLCNTTADDSYAGMHRKLFVLLYKIRQIRVYSEVSCCEEIFLSRSYTSKWRICGEKWHHWENQFKLHIWLSPRECYLSITPRTGDRCKTVYFVFIVSEHTTRLDFQRKKKEEEWERISSEIVPRLERVDKLNNEDAMWAKW